ncbi:related to CWC23-Component of a complex containing Cef1p, putatively involved in pre-mRNA splicing [Zygosaccharomyces bailii ISA1307]|nr:related to CWC23-Component of a complex containing Cef1p, putatively involved in pre-mRNA splicing [Zygosaccharomyces bailii ISA1307]
MSELQHVFEQQVNLYHVLELKSSHVSDSIIKKQFRLLALKYHPDKNPDNPHIVHKFHRLSLATHVLTDESLKSQYDRWLANQDDGERVILIERLKHREKQAKATATEPTTPELYAIQKYGESLRRMKHFKVPYNWSLSSYGKTPNRFYDSSTLRIELLNDPQSEFLNKAILCSTLENLWKLPLSGVYYSSKNSSDRETVVAYVVFVSSLDSRRIYKSYKAHKTFPKFLKQISPRIPTKYYKHRKERQLSLNIEQLVRNHPLYGD